MRRERCGVVREDRNGSPVSNRAERRECPLIPGKPEVMIVSGGQAWKSETTQ